MDTGPYISPPVPGSKLTSIAFPTFPNPSSGTHILVISRGYQICPLSEDKSVLLGSLDSISTWASTLSRMICVSLSQDEALVPAGSLLLGAANKTPRLSQNTFFWLLPPGGGQSGLTQLPPLWDMPL